MQIRREGVTSGTSDTYFFSPSGKRFRSCAEIARHFRLDPSAPRKRPSLGSGKGAKASGGPPPQLLPPPPARFASPPPSTSTDGESSGGGADTESAASLPSSSSLLAAEAAEAAAAPGEGRVSQYAAPSAAEAAARRKSVTLAEYRATEHARRVDEQAALVRALRAFFGSEPGLQGAPVFPALTPNLPGYRAAYGRWADGGSALSRLVELVAAEMRSCAHLHETPSATWCKNKLATVGKLVGLEDAEAFAAFTPGIPTSHKTALPAAAAPATSGEQAEEQVEELRWVPKSEAAAALLHWLEAPGAANEGVWMSLEELDARYCAATGAAPYAGVPWTHPIHVLFRAKYDCVSCAALDAVHRTTAGSKKGSHRYILGKGYKPANDGPHWLPALAAGTRDRKRVEPFSPPATPPAPERHEPPPPPPPPPPQEARPQEARPPPPAVLKQCSACRKELGAPSFSNTQWSKGAGKRRCKACIGDNLHAEPANPGPITALGRDVYTVEALLAQRRVRGRREYLVRWQNWAPEDDTWEVHMTSTQPPASRLPPASSSPPAPTSNPSPDCAQTRMRTTSSTRS